MTDYANNWKRHYRKSKVRFFDIKTNIRNRYSDITLHQFQTLDKQRGYSINLTCNKCDELAVDSKGNLLDRCKNCGHKFIKLEL